MGNTSATMRMRSMTAPSVRCQHFGINWPARSWNSLPPRRSWRFPSRTCPAWRSCSTDNSLKTEVSTFSSLLNDHANIWLLHEITKLRWVFQRKNFYLKNVFVEENKSHRQQNRTTVSDLWFEHIRITIACLHSPVIRFSPIIQWNEHAQTSFNQGSPLRTNFLQIP